jgi:hypothetical protein
MRADDPASLDTAIERLRALLQTPELRAERDEAHDTALLEGFIPGPEYAVEGVLHHGVLQDAGDLREARSAVRPVLRGDDLPHASRLDAR